MLWARRSQRRLNGAVDANGAILELKCSSDLPAVLSWIARREDVRVLCVLAMIHPQVRNRRVVRPVSIDPTRRVRNGYTVRQHINVDTVAISPPIIIEYVLAGRRAGRHLKSRDVPLTRPAALNEEAVKGDNPWEACAIVLYSNLSGEAVAVGEEWVERRAAVVWPIRVGVKMWHHACRTEGSLEVIRIALWHYAHVMTIDAYVIKLLMIPLSELMIFVPS